MYDSWRFVRINRLLAGQPFECGNKVTVGIVIQFEEDFNGSAGVVGPRHAYV